MEGFSLILDFITKEEEYKIMSFVKRENKKRTTGRNNIQRFGSNVPYNNFVVSEQIPDYLNNLSKKIYSLGGLTFEPDSVSINEYYPNQNIVPHIDSKSSGDVITVLSLLGPAEMIFEKKEEKLKFHILPRSLIQIKGEARAEWKHSIEPVKEMRYSIVFRCSKN